MNLFNVNLCLIVLTLLGSSLVLAEDNHSSNGNIEEELVPAEQTIDNSDISSVVKKKSLTKPVAKNLKPFVLPNLSRNIGPNTGFPFAHGLIQAPFVGLPLDGQASSATNNVLLVLNNDKNKLGDFSKQSEQPLKRLTRTPDVMDDMVAQARGLSEGVTQQVMGQLTESGSGFTRQLGQGLNDLVRQTATLAQTSPGNIDLAQVAQTLRQSTPVGNFDFGSFGEGLTRSFLDAATQNVFNPAVGQAPPDAAVAEEADIAEALPDVVGAAAETEAEAEPEAAAEPTAAAEAEASEGQKNPLDSMLGSVFTQPAFALGAQTLPALQAITSLQQSLPLGLLGPLSALNPLMALGSDISEVRVMPDQYSPYKLSPKQVDQQTMAEMKLKAVLKDALNKKTLPILWFHLPNNKNVQKSSEDLEMEAKLKNFEKRVIAELKHLQELAKLANVVKESQLESGVQPTSSLNTKLNLHDIPIYEITLADIENTLKDEHVIMLMHTIVQRQHREHHRHHQATTKYLTDLTGTPIKRQTKTAEDVLKSMERDDILKMLTYAYRMAAVSGHELPWLKDDKIKGLNEKDTSKNTMGSQQRQSISGNTQMKDERQWLEDKQRQMAMEAEKQRQMADERKHDTTQNQLRQWADPHITQQPIERQWANPNMMQQQMPLQRQMQQPMPIQNQMFDPNMQQQMFNMQPQMPEQRQWIQPTNMQQEQPIMTNPMMQRQWADPNINQQPMPIQRQWAEMPETKSSIKTEQLPEQRQAADTKMPEQQTAFKSEKQTEQRQWADPSGGLKNPQQAEQRQWIDTKAPQQTATKINEPPMMQRQWADTNKPQPTAERMDSMPVVGEAKPQMAENGGQARHKGLEDMFNEFDVFDHGKHKGKEAAKPTVINYYYNAGGGRYQPLYAPQPSPSRPPSPATSYGYARPASPPSPPAPQTYAVTPQYKPAASPYGGASYGSNAYGSYGGYRAAVGDEEIAIMLQQHQPMPKIMPRIPNNAEPIHAFSNIANINNNNNNNNRTTKENHINNAEVDPNKTQTKRLAQKQIQLNLEPAAYIIVIRNNTNKSGKQQVRSRRKRSTTEYATLEPIDESSLDALRKTYKNSLKEITLNPDETPADALRRYNAETIREALEKANQKPMEISAGGEEEDVKEENVGNKFEQQQQQHLMSQQPQSYVLNNNAAYMPVAANIPNQINNEPYITYPVPMSSAAYEPSLNQEGVYNNFIPKYNQPQVFSTNNRLTQNPFLSMYHSLESVPYIDDYNLNNQAYQVTNHNVFNTPTKASKSIVYQKSYVQPQLMYNNMPIHMTKSANSINKNRPQMYTSGHHHHHIVDYDKSQNSQFANDISDFKTVQSFSKVKNKWSRQPQNERYKTTRPQESASFENLMTVIKERLAQCCNECKENILKSLDETLKQRHYDSNRNKPKVLEINVKPYASVVNRAHPISYRKSSRDEDFEYKQWLMEMSEKGYDKNYLTKQHQRNYLKDGKLNLHIEDEEDNGAEQEQTVFYKNNQSYKRETTEPEAILEETEAAIVTDSIKIENNIENLQEQNINEGEVEEDEQEQEEEEVEHEEIELEDETDIDNETEKPNVNEIKAKDLNKKSIKDLKSNKVNFEEKKLKTKTVNSTQKLETAESTTHSVYALRGQFRPHKHNPMPFALKQGKQFPNYKNVNKLGTKNIVIKSNDNKKNSIDKDDKLEEILDILHDLSIQSKTASNTDISSTSTSTTTTTTTTPLPIKNSANVLTNALSNKQAEAKNTNKKEVKRRRIRIPSKSRKILKKSPSPSKSDIKLETEK